VWAAIPAAILTLLSSPLFAGEPGHYLFTNNDPPGKLSNSSTFYTVGANGSLAETATITTGFGWIGGGDFGQYRVGALRKGKEQCVYVSDSFSGLVAGIVVQTLKVAGAFAGSSTDSGMFNGVGLALNSDFLYASYTASNTIGTFKILPKCKLQFVG